MISAFDLSFDVTEEMMGVIVERLDPAPKEGDPVKIYIPVLMPNIDKSIPSVQKKVINRGSKLFLNANNCKPMSKPILTTQNYITGTMEKNTSWINEKTSRVHERPLENLDGYKINIHGTDYDGRTLSINVSEQYREYYIAGGEKVNCYAPNGKLSKLLFDNDMYS